MPRDTGSVSTPSLKSTQTGRRERGSSRPPDTKPRHYQRLNPQPIEVIEAWGLNFVMGSALKYIARAGHKEDELRDLRKAIWFLKRQLAVREAQISGAPIPTPEDQA